MIQEIGPHRFHNRYEPDRRIRRGDRGLCFRGRKVLAGVSGGTLTFPEAGDGGTYLFSVDDTAYWLTEGAEETGEFSFHDMSEIRSLPLQPKEEVFAAFTGWHLREWYRRSRFCGACGAPMEKDGIERAMRCPVCGEVFYPRLNPAVIVGVISGEKLLVTRYRRGFSQNALVAGFVEVGETLEEACAREVYEEAGVRVHSFRYFASQPWGVASDLLTGFFCEAEADSTVRMDTGELSYAAFLTREEIVLQTREYSLTNEMMRCFKEGRVDAEIFRSQSTPDRTGVLRPCPDR